MRRYHAACLLRLDGAVWVVNLLVFTHRPVSSAFVFLAYAVFLPLIVWHMVRWFMERE